MKSWSATQKRVTLSSAEAELGAFVKTTTETIGLVQLASGLGKELEAEIFVERQLVPRFRLGVYDMTLPENIGTGSWTKK